MKLKKTFLPFSSFCAIVTFRCFNCVIWTQGGAPNCFDGVIFCCLSSLFYVKNTPSKSSLEQPHVTVSLAFIGMSLSFWHLSSYENYETKKTYIQYFLPMQVKQIIDKTNYLPIEKTRLEKKSANIRSFGPTWDLLVFPVKWTQQSTDRSIDWLSQF